MSDQYLIEKLSDIIDTLRQLVYDLFSIQSHWFEHPAVNAYGKLLDYKYLDNMNLEQQAKKFADKSKPRVRYVADEFWVDKTLTTYYRQVSSGLPEEQRVKLTQDQMETVNFSKQLDIEAAKRSSVESRVTIFNRKSLFSLHSSLNSHQK